MGKFIKMIKQADIVVVRGLSVTSDKRIGIIPLDIVIKCFRVINDLNGVFQQSGVHIHILAE